MTNEETLRKLTEMKMTAMVDSYKEQIMNQDYRDMTFEERFNLIVDHEYSLRHSNKLQRLIKQAQFNDPSVAIEDIEYHPDCHLDKHLILELASGNYIAKHLNIIIMGPSGSGKTWLSNAFGTHACRQHYRVKYIRLPELLDEFISVKNEANGSFRRLIKKHKKVELLIIDEWLLPAIPEEHTLTLFEIIESRLKKLLTTATHLYH